MLVCLGGYGILLLFYCLYRKKKVAINIEKELARKVFCILFLTFTVGMCMEWEISLAAETVEKLERKGYGEGTREEVISMQIEGEDEESVQIEISERKYTEEELQEAFLQVKEVLEEEVLGENEETSRITEDLNLLEEVSGFPFRIYWEFSRYDVINMNGQLQDEVIVREDPGQEGIEVTVTAILKYELEEQRYSTQIRIYHPEKKVLSVKDVVLEQIAKTDSESREEQYVMLPESVDGRAIVWKKEHTSKSLEICFFGISVSILIVYMDRQQKIREQQEREKQMLFDYPEIISQFIVLIGAGMSVKNAWKKMVYDYRKQKQDTGRIRWAYEEMEYTYQEMQSGVSELECYERFIKRCNLRPYMKLGALLAQNLRKGTKGIWAQLEIESYQAMEERKSQIKKLGEEAGTKLLIPMLMMLIVVLLIVIVPAFISIQIG